LRGHRFRAKASQKKVCPEVCAFEGLSGERGGGPGVVPVGDNNPRGCALGNVPGRWLYSCMQGQS